MHACDEGHRVDWEGTKILATILEEKSPRSHPDKEDQHSHILNEHQVFSPISFFQSTLSTILSQHIISCVFMPMSSIPVYISLFCTPSPHLAEEGPWTETSCIVAVVLLNCMNDVSF